MTSKVMQIFYGVDCLPYKDKERVVHFPIVGSAFQGASQTTEIRFYVDLIGGVNCTWVALAKLPNGKIGSEILSLQHDDELDEDYVSMSLSSFYTQEKGDLYISLQGYDGGVELNYDSETEIYSIVGTPVIQATGSVKIAINYATQVVGSDEYNQITFQEMLAFIGSKLDKNSGFFIKVVQDILDINSSTNKDYLSSGDVVYSKLNKKFYLLSGTYPSFVATEIVLNPTELNVSGLAKIEDEIRVIKGTSYLTFGENGLVSLQDYLDEKQNVIPLVTISPTHSGTISPSALLNSLALFPSYLTYTDNGQSFIYEHCGSDSTYYYFRKLFKESVHDNSEYLIYGGDVYIQVNKSTGAYSQQGVQYNLYSKAQADTLLGAKADKSDTYTKKEIDTKLTSMLVYKGSKTVAELNALAPSLGETQTGWFYNVSDSGTLNDGSVEVLAGDNVAWTGSSWDKLTMDLSAYDDKFIAAGFFEVQNYNETTGEITFVYASDLYDMSYNGTTGVLTIEAN